MRDIKKRIVAVVVTGLLLMHSAGCGRDGKEETLEELDAQQITEETEAENADGKADAEEISESEHDPEQKSEQEPERICVFVCGAVYHPGVYELSSQDRVFQAIEAAGGMLDMAAPSAVNQAEKLEDGQQIYIPSVEEVQTGVWQGAETNASGDPNAGSAKVNLNTATREELMTLTGIGESKADAIIRYRETCGGFETTEELMQVEGIKEGTFEKIKEDIEI